MRPAPITAVSIAPAPKGAIPPPVSVFDGVKPDANSRTIVRIGTMILNTVMMLLSRVISTTPNQLIAVKKIRRSAAATRPRPLSLPSATSAGNHRLAYWSSPDASLGKPNAVWSSRTQPIITPTNGPEMIEGQRTLPPAIGRVTPSSMKVRPTSTVAMAAMIHETMARGPAAAAAKYEANSQPEP